MSSSSPKVQSDAKGLLNRFEETPDNPAVFKKVAIMGQLFSLNSTPKYDWDINLPLQRSEFRKISARYDASQPLRIRIAGPTRLSCTLEVDDAVITINNNGHRLVVSGNNNTIRVWGDGVRIRIEGNGNTLTGTGTDTVLYTNGAVDTSGIVLARQDALGADGAPERLDLCRAPVNDNAGSGDGTKEDLKLIRLAYKDRQEGGDDDHSDDAGNENEEEDEEEYDEEEDDEDEDDAVNSSSGSGYLSGNNGKGKKRGGDGEKPADSDIKKKQKPN